MKAEINKMEIVDGVLLSIENAQGEVIIPNEVHTIVDNVFCGMDEVTTVRGENVNEIGDCNFRDNANLKKIDLPKLGNCGCWNFCYNVNLAEITLPNLATCGNENFCHNENLTEINFPNLASCGNENFYRNANLAEIALPNLASCGGWNFRYNKKLIDIALPNLSNCGSCNFRYNDNLDEITLPNLETCGDYNFRNNEKLSKINGQKVVCIDGITSILISKKGNIFKTKTLLRVENNELITTEEFVYIVTDGNGNYAHGATIKEAKADLIYKIVGRNSDEYKHLTMDSILTHEEAITCYRTITGACAYGTREFVENILNGDKKEQYAISEIVKITENHYGNETFMKFFKN